MTDLLGNCTNKGMQNNRRLWGKKKEAVKYIILFHLHLLHDCMMSVIKLFTKVQEEISLRYKNQYLGYHLQISFSFHFYPSSHCAYLQVAHPPSVCYRG